MKELIKSSFENYGFKLNEKQVEQFEKYYNYLIEENQKFNLTAITDKKEVVVKHFIDSVLPENEIKHNARVIDVGTGAGFPGLPLKIVRPDLKLTLLDSLNKRIEFLKRLSVILEINDITFVHARAEDYVVQMREKFDVATSRAVASIPTLSEYLLPYVKCGGVAVMYKGGKAEEELLSGEQAIKVLGGKFKEIKKFTLIEIEGERKVVLIEKKQPTPSKYPRGKNLPKTKPIV